jgi:hypothetical protein
MPWQGSERFAFEIFSILQHAPTRSGVYVTVARGKWVYVGEADNLCGQLLLDLEGDNPCIARYRPTHFAFELVAPRTRKARQQELIQEFRPVCNGGRVIVTYH